MKCPRCGSELEPFRGQEIPRLTCPACAAVVIPLTESNPLTAVLVDYFEEEFDLVWQRTHPAHEDPWQAWVNVRMRQLKSEGRAEVVVDADREPRELTRAETAQIESLGYLPGRAASLVLNASFFPA